MIPFVFQNQPNIYANMCLAFTGTSATSSPSTRTGTRRSSSPATSGKRGGGQLQWSTNIKSLIPKLAGYLIFNIGFSINYITSKPCPGVPILGHPLAIINPVQECQCWVILYSNYYLIFISCFYFKYIYISIGIIGSLFQIFIRAVYWSESYWFKWRVTPST